MNPALRYIIFGLGAACLASQISGCGLMRESAGPQSSVQAPFIESEPLPYDVEIRVEDLPDGQSAQPLRSGMEASSQLILLKDKLPDGVLGLMRRAHADRDSAVKLLRSLGYYDGSADAVVVEPEQEGGKAHVILTLFAGSLYSIGKTDLFFQPELVPLPQDLGKGRPVPKSIDGLESGQPATARSVLDAVDRLPGEFHKSGYPWAKTTSTRNILDRTAKTLDVEVTVDAGTPAVMGDVAVASDTAVSPDYIRMQSTWRKGAVWNEERIARYREHLQKLGLFRAVDIKPVPQGSALPVEGESHV